MRLLFRLLLVAPLISACDPPTQPKALAFEASSPKPLTEPAADVLGTREDGLGLAVGAAIPPFEIQDFRGETFSSTAINDANTLVVLYRGGWCPFSTTTKWRCRRFSSFGTARSPGLTSPETTRRVRAPSNS